MFDSEGNRTSSFTEKNQTTSKQLSDEILQNLRDCEG